MKQKLINLKSWLLMMCLLVGVGSAWAEDVTFEPASDQSFPKNGITLTVTDGTLTNGTDYRVYKGQTMTISSTVGNITNIALTYTSASYDGGGWAASYQPNATSWTSPKANGEQARINKLVVTVSSGDTPTPTTYTVTIANDIANGTVTANSTSAKEGDDITLTATPATGYEFGSWNVTDAASNPITVTDNKFRMPAANVNVSATFNQIQGGGEPSGETASFIFNTDAGLSALEISKPSNGVGKDLGALKYTSGDITMTATDGGVNTRVWNSNGTTSLRVYKNGGSLTFSGATITKIVFTGTVPMTANVGTFSDKTWTGEASSVTFTATNSVTISTIEVTYASDSKTTPTLSFAEETYNVTKGESFAAPILNNPNNVTVTYTSSKTDVATVNATTGEVTLVAPGTTKITASFAGDDTYNATSASYNLVVAGAKYTVTIITPENGTLTIKDGETIINSGDEVAEGTELTIVVEAADGYRFKNWQYKVGDASWATRYTNPQNYDMPSANVQFRANCDPIPTYTIAWSVNGTIVKSEELKEGATVTAPATPEDINGKSFTGWVETSTVDASPAYVTPSATAEKTVTYYAVFATTDGQEPSAYVRVTELSQLAEKKQIVVVHNSDNMVLTHENGNLSGTTQSTAGLNESDNKISIPNDNYVWSIGGDEENGWVLSANGNSLGVNTLPDTDRTGQNADISFTSSNNVWTIGEHNTSGCFYIQNLGETEGTTSIAASYYNGKFNVFTTNGLTSSNSSAFKLYVPNAAITYSDFTTTPDCATITIGQYEYATLVAPCNLDFEGTGVTAYAITAAELDNSVVKTTEIIKVPAGKPIIVHGAQGDHKIPRIAEAAGFETLLEASESVVYYDDNAAYDYYYLGVNGGKVCFKQLTSGSLAAGKCFFKIAKGSEVKMFTMIVDDEDATGISTVKNNKGNNGAVYNLAGQRVDINTKGIIIVNGKKMLNK